MTHEEFAREFEKAPKNLMKAKPNELFFAEDHPEGRMRLVCAAMNGERDALMAAAGQILARPEGARHLVRALNNLKEIGHSGALCFAESIYRSLESDWDDDTRLLKFIQITDSVSSGLRTGLGWISEKAAEILDAERISPETRIRVWSRWCAAMLRSSPDAAPLIEQIGPRRPKNLSRTAANALKNSFANPEQPWDLRSAAAYLLLGNQLIPPAKAQAFAEEAYASFPLDALEGVEILAIAIECDASSLAEAETVHSCLAQIRKENLILRDMRPGDFLEASTRAFRSLGELPASALDVAIGLADCEKSARMIRSAFIDDARRADWLHLAAKNNMLRTLGGIFFRNMDVENPLCASFSADLVSALLENANADALKAAEWLNAVQDGDAEAMRAAVRRWIDFCEN